MTTVPAVLGDLTTIRKLSSGKYGRRALKASWPDLFRPCTSFLPSDRKMWMPATSAGMTKAEIIRTHQMSVSYKSVQSGFTE